MKKTIIYPIRFRIRHDKTIYNAGENEFEEYVSEKMTFPLNHVIQNDVSKDDEICVLLVRTDHPERETKKYAEEAKEEISNILSGHCKSIEFKDITTPYASTKEELGQIYKSLCKEIVPASNVFVDFTFGPKYMPLILFCVLNYAEKYMNCTISRLIYGLFDTRRENSGTMVDFTTLYLLNTFGAMFDGSKSSFDTFVGKILK